MTMSDKDKCEIIQKELNRVSECIISEEMLPAYKEYSIILRGYLLAMVRPDKMPPRPEPLSKVIPKEEDSTL